MTDRTYGGDHPRGIPGLKLDEIAWLLDNGEDVKSVTSFEDPEAIIRDMWHHIGKLKEQAALVEKLADLVRRFHVNHGMIDAYDHNLDVEAVHALAEYKAASRTKETPHA